jgi:dihydrolipoamide dehydrogenase
VSSAPEADLLVLGAGPGGYTAAFRAADLGLDVVLVERHERLGGVCLNVGCIPSKALLHVAKVIADAERLSAHGVSFGAPRVDLDATREWKRDVVSRLTRGLGGMAKQRGVRVIRGDGVLSSPGELLVGGESVRFKHAILATGSSTVRLPGIPYEDERVMTSTDALELSSIPGRLLVIGGGIIGLELATVYDALGSRVTVVEMAEQLIPGCDADLVRPLQKRIEARYEAILTSSVVSSLEARRDGLRAVISTAGGEPREDLFDGVLVAVGRTPNSGAVGLGDAGVAVDERGFVTVDAQLRTSAPNIHAIGDLVGTPMLAHKASHEGVIAAEVIAGLDVELDVRGIPSVAYTDPEIAWVGLTETEAAADGIDYECFSVPWAASGRALASDAADGVTKLIVEPGTRRILGAGITGAGAGELIAETVLALELTADSQDIALTSHAHPTLAETIALAAQSAEGTVTDLPPRRR